MKVTKRDVKNVAKGAATGAAAGTAYTLWHPTKIGAKALESTYDYNRSGGMKPWPALKDASKSGGRWFMAHMPPKRKFLKNALIGAAVGGAGKVVIFTKR